MFNLPELMRVIHQQLSAVRAERCASERDAGYIEALLWVRERIGVIADQDDLP